MLYNGRFIDPILKVLGSKHRIILIHVINCSTDLLCIEFLTSGHNEKIRFEKSTPLSEDFKL